MYKNLAAMFVAACCVLPAFPAFSQAQAPATMPLKIGFVCVAPVLDAGRALSDEPVLAMNFLGQGVPGKLDRKAPVLS